MGLTYRARREDDVLVVTVAGVFNLDSQREMRSWICRDVKREDCRSIVLDMRPLVQTLYWSDQWEDAARLAQESPRQPLALVVPAQFIEQADVYCEAMDEMDRLRQAFVDLPPALGWAQRRWEWDGRYEPTQWPVSRRYRPVAAVAHL